jgi:hypothetical protein
MSDLSIIDSLMSDLSIIDSLMSDLSISGIFQIYYIKTLSIYFYAIDIHFWHLAHIHTHSGTPDGVIYAPC